MTCKCGGCVSCVTAQGGTMCACGEWDCEDYEEHCEEADYAEEERAAQAEDWHRQEVMNDPRWEGNR